MKTIYTHSANEQYTVEKTLVTAGYSLIGSAAGKRLYMDYHTEKQIMVVRKINPDAWND